jgi:hypothetical protein
LDRNPGSATCLPAYGVVMVYFLIGGPRSRQLVDELPSGYRAGDPDAGGAALVVTEDLVAASAIWDGIDGTPAHHR